MLGLRDDGKGNEQRSTDSNEEGTKGAEVKDEATEAEAAAEVESGVFPGLMKLGGLAV